MKVAIISIDSDIGAELYKLHNSLGDTVVATSRIIESHIFLDLGIREKWTPMPDVDRIYYCIGTHERGVPRTQVMNVNALWSVEYLGYLAKELRPETQIVVFTSHMGSIDNTNDARAWVYRMSKAALNMGIACMARYYPNVNWCLYHPGVVKTKILGDRWQTFAQKALEPKEAAQICMERINEWDGQFTFLSYTGKTISW